MRDDSAVSTPPRIRRLTWFTKANCGLCDEAWPHVARAAQVLRLEVEQVDVLGDPSLQRAYGRRLPVLARGDEVLAEGAITRGEAWRALLRARFGR